MGLVILLILLIAVLISGQLIVLKNKGFSIDLMGIVAVITIAMICSVIQILAKRPSTVNTSIAIYYMAFFTGLFFLTRLIRSLDNNYRFVIYRQPITYLCLLGNIMMIYNMITGNMFSSKKRIMIGRNWWIIHAKDQMLFNIFRLIAIISAIYIIYVLVQTYIKSAKIYRFRVLTIAVGFILLTIFHTTADISFWPTWLFSIFMFMMACVLIYLIVFAGESRLRRSTLLSFANELSEGFILYDDKDALVYVNPLLERALTEKQLKDFRKKSEFEKWASEVEVVKGIRVKKMIKPEKTIYARIYSHEIIDNNVFIGTFFNLKDTTDSIVQLETMERINEELEQTARMKSDFLANMSHEIRTPMNAVIGMAEMALREEMTPQGRSYINQIRTSGHNLLNIINDILDFSKIESGKMDIIPDEYEPTSELQDVANTLMTRIGDKDIELIVNIDPTIPNKLIGDAMRIRQILINLANNAIKFTKQGQVCIDFTYKKISEDTVNIIFHVIDTGMGIKEEDLKKLFVSFQQVDSKRNRSIEGTGLGLAISKRLVEAMGGSVGVTSEYGVGSDFYFELPQKIADNTEAIHVEDKENLFVIGTFGKDYLDDCFITNMKNLGVAAKIYNKEEDTIEKLKEYAGNVSDSTKVFVMFDKKMYDVDLRSFLESNIDIMGIIFVDFDSLFSTQQANLRVIRRPFTTFSFAMALNGKISGIELESGDSDIEFTAPTAKILIVDDNKINLTVAEGLLEPLGMMIHTADSGFEAIKMIEHEYYDIIFMDHMMPGMDGIETTKHIRQNLPQAEDTPIIALTANAIAGAKDMFLSNGMNDFVSKPIELKTIISKVRKYLPKDKIIKKNRLDDSAEIINNANAVELNIPGIDCEAAIKLIGSEKLYLKVLEDYFKRIDMYYSEIEQCFNAENWQDYTVKVHALKSSSRQIGAMELSEKAAKLEAAGHELDITYIKNNTEDMLNGYMKVKEILSEYFGEEESSDAGIEVVEIDKEAVIETLKEIIDKCEDLDIDGAEEASKKLKGYNYNQEQMAIIESISEAIDNMDIETCSEKAEEMIGLL